MAMKHDLHPNLNLLGPALGIPHIAGVTSSLSGNTYVVLLQTALTKLAKATNNDRINPHTTSGKFDCATARALSYAVPIVRQRGGAVVKQVPDPVWAIAQWAYCGICLEENPLGTLAECGMRAAGLSDAASPIQAAADREAVEQNAASIAAAIEAAANEPPTDTPNVPAATGRSDLARRLLAQASPTYQAPQRVLDTSTRSYPAGSLAVFDEALHKWRIAIPKGVMMTAGATGLGQTALTEQQYQSLLSQGTAYKETSLIPPTTSQPTTANIVTMPQYKKLVQDRLYDAPKAWYAKPWVWAIVGGSVAALGGGYYLYSRRGTRAAAPQTTVSGYYF